MEYRSEYRIWRDEIMEGPKRLSIIRKLLNWLMKI